MSAIAVVILFLKEQKPFSLPLLEDTLQDNMIIIKIIIDLPTIKFKQLMLAKKKRVR